MPASSGNIEVTNLVRHFGAITAVDGVSFSIRPGEFFSLLGENGAGKSTTLYMLTTLLRPSAGSARVNGRDVGEAPLAVRDSIGLVFQETTLDRDLTVAENLKFTCALYGMNRRQSSERIDEILGVLEMIDRRDQLVRRLSGGLRRRLDIARGLMHRAQVLFLDEPTTGLDPHAREAIWSFIDALRKTHGITVFLTTHYLEEAERSDRVGILDRGKLVALGAPAELKRALKGEVVQVRTTDDAAAEMQIATHLGVTVRRSADGLFVTAESAETLVPELFRILGIQIVAVNMHRPSLNDVFLHLTGKRLPTE
jgi:ABC-2 type transport system ATP-binding protein